MKNKVTKLSEFEASIILNCVADAILIGLSCIGLFFSQPGWVIGTAIGSIVSILTFVLTTVSSKKVLKESKAGLFLVVSFAKAFLAVGFFAMLVIFDKTLGIPAFKNSFWGFIIGFSPSALLTIVCQLTFSKEGQGD